MLFYTVRCDRRGYPVQYIDPETRRVKTFHGPFDDPGEASQEFQISVSASGVELCYLDEAAFQGKARAFSRQSSKK